MKIIKTFIRNFRYSNSISLCKDTNFPKNLLLIITNPRSGSTWFTDAMRCHPSIEFHESAIVYKSLSLIGRRYPRDLSNTKDSSYEIEIVPNKLAKIPVFNDESDFNNVESAFLKENKFCIEKIHPEFFFYKSRKMLAKMKFLQSQSINLKVIYVVREPKAAISSFISYQQRNPQWYSTFQGKELISYMKSTYKTLFYLASKQAGIIWDYSDLAYDLEGTLTKTYEYLWSEVKEERDVNKDFVLQRAIQTAMFKTSRTERQKQNTTFLGQQTGTVSGSYIKNQVFFEEHTQGIQECVEFYDKLMKLKAIYT